ncbi:arylsulfatase a and related enzymes [Bacillus sp. OxB-1]|uniref:DUF4365 domain-containing protein n=1 Tax=Bacillus sp. (strain OxB-1) TaxID=98228 RepID=UPI000581BDF9|nr:DUF4365 domain-containing protein [Bacillus sp. OxB-1]BAQ10178.1 arylsulfatase a and related enzymes [Bacillus sp. OxB-1]
MIYNYKSTCVWEELKITRLTRNNQLEQKSKITFQYLTLPWESQSFDHDTGLDLIVQPYDELEKERDGSIPPFRRRFLVQLKSTETEVLNAKQNIGKLQIDIAHLKSWKMERDPVMIARYYLEHNCFYFQWVDKIDIKENQLTQVINLPNRFDNEIKDQVKNNILDYLIPPNISKLVYEPVGIDSGRGAVTISNIRRGQQIANLLEDLIPQISTEINLRQELQKCKYELLKNGLDTTLRFKMVFLLLKLGELNESLSELNILINSFSSVEAKIINSLLQKSGIKLFRNISKLDFKYVLILEEGIEPGTEIIISLDGKEYRISEYKKYGVPLPKQNFSKIDFIQFKQKSSSASALGKGFVFSFPIRLKYSIKVLREISLDNRAFGEYSETILSDEISVARLSFD